MKTIAAPMLFVALLFSVSIGSIQPPDPQPAPQLDPDLQWLTQLVGQWDVQFEMNMGPDEPPSEATGTDTVRAIGDHWVVAETKTTLFGQPFSGVLSLGYDARKQHYVGTWIDSMSGYLWTYKGTLNEARDTLTLETSGPSMEGPDANSRYREYIKITGKNTRTFKSTIETTDGTWMTILTTKYSRKN